jgi:hypothetical protein
VFKRLEPPWLAAHRPRSLGRSLSGSHAFLRVGTSEGRLEDPQRHAPPRLRHDQAILIDLYPASPWKHAVPWPRAAGVKSVQQNPGRYNTLYGFRTCETTVRDVWPQ